MSNKEKRSKWLEQIYYVGMLMSIFFILGQAYYARRSIMQTNEWEKAKMTIENIERFKESLTDSPIEDVWMLGDRIWADFSTSKGREMADTLLVTFNSLYDNDRTKVFPEYIRMIEIMDAFAYPIIMGYASEESSCLSTMRQYYAYSNFIMPEAYNTFRNIGIHAKLLYRLWRIRYEIMVIDTYVSSFESLADIDLSRFKERQDHLLCYEEADISKASLQKYRKKLDKRLNEMRKEIEVFRKSSLK